MARYEFYEIRTRRDDASDADDADPGSGFRRSYACVERPDLTLFTWQREDGELEAFQLLFEERFLEWQRDRTPRVGETSRRESVSGAGRFKGVRTLTDAAPDASLDIRRQGLALLAESRLPMEIEGAIRGAMAEMQAR